MRGLRTLLVLLVIAGALGGYLWYDLQRDPAADDGRENAFANVESDTIEEVRIKGSAGETTRLQKSGDRWALAEPVTGDADQSEANSIASNLATIDIQRVVDENAADLKQYGLEPARIEVQFRAKGQTEPRTIAFGNKTPTGGDLYAKLPGSSRVFLVASFLESTFDKTTFALRDKTLLKFERDKADGLELASGAALLQFAKAGSEWRMVKPYAARADYGAVEAAVDRLASAQMQSLVDDTSTPERFGFDKPAATLTVASGSARSTLTLGATDNALVFAKDSSRPAVFTVAPTLGTDLVKDPGEYRRKDLFDARAFTANRVELTRAGTPQVFVKSKDGDKDVWKDGAGKVLDAAKVDDLLTKLTALRAQSFVASAPPALSSPVLTAVMRFDDSKNETVRIARAAADVVAARGDEPGAARLEAMSFDEIVKALDALK
jgi:hypothetical protein